jgi:hypothetical protein
MKKNSIIYLLAAVFVIVGCPGPFEESSRIPATLSDGEGIVSLTVMTEDTDTRTLLPAIAITRYKYS